MMDKNYIELYNQIKEHIRHSQQKTILSVNVQMLFLYWEIGNFISQQKEKLGWGAKVVDKLARDLSSEFPDTKGFSLRNLQYMVKFAETYPPHIISKLASSKLPAPFVQAAPAQLEKSDKTIMQAPTALLQNTNYQPAELFHDFAQSDLSKLTWTHHLVILDKTSSFEEKNYYIKRTISESWSYRVLIHRIEQKLYESQGNLPNNFDQTLTQAQSELAKQALKDNYIFDFLNIKDEVKERELEKGLLKEITKFLLALGNGFAFMGQQFQLRIGGQDYYLDLLFFHTKLNCYLIIELKIGDFKPEYAGKMSFYLSAADDLLKQKQHNATIGLLLCKSTNKIIAEYSLKDNTKPIGIATYKLLPKEESFVKLLNRN